MELCVAGYGYWHCCCCCCFFYAVCFVRQIIFYFFRISFQHLFENQFVCKWVSLSVCVVDAWCWYCGLCYLRKKKKNNNFKTGTTLWFSFKWRSDGNERQSEQYMHHWSDDAFPLNVLFIVRLLSQISFSAQIIVRAMFIHSIFCFGVCFSFYLFHSFS